MGQQKNLTQLAKMLHYVLGVQPDEFGLVLDKDGYVKEKDLLKVLSEEDGWRHVRQGLLNELMISVQPPPVERTEGKIRAVDRSGLRVETASDSAIPKLLHYGVRPKEYPIVLSDGLLPVGDDEAIVMSADKDTALRMAKRRHNDPVMVTVHTRKVIEMGNDLHQTGENIFVSRFIDPDCISGPPLPSQDTEPRSKPKKPGVPKKPQEHSPGSFLMDVGEAGHVPKSLKKKEKGNWKGDKKRMRREKQNFWPGES